MIIVEYRVPMPFSVDEYRIGQLYTIAKKSKLESADSRNGVRINANEPYSNGYAGQGQYTNKTYYLANKMPEFLRPFMPGSALTLQEEAWNAYPYSRNVFTNPLLDKIQLDIESRYLDGFPVCHEAGGPFERQASASELRTKSIVQIDMVKDQYLSRSKQEASACSEREMLAYQPRHKDSLVADWLKEYQLDYDLDHFCIQRNFDGISRISRNLMTCYKLCRISFPVWPLQNKLEQYIQNHCRDTILEAHRQAWLWQDEWRGLSIDDVRRMEQETAAHLQQFMPDNKSDQSLAKELLT